MELCFVQWGFIANVVGLCMIFEEVFPSLCILSYPGESFLESCPGMFKVVTGEAPPWSCTEPGACWD